MKQNLTASQIRHQADLITELEMNRINLARDNAFKEMVLDPDTEKIFYLLLIPAIALFIMLIHVWGW